MRWRAPSESNPLAMMKGDKVSKESIPRHCRHRPSARPVLCFSLFSNKLIIVLHPSHVLYNLLFPLHSDNK